MGKYNQLLLGNGYYICHLLAATREFTDERQIPAAWRLMMTHLTEGNH